MGPARGVNCNHLVPLTVLATLAAFLMALCFRLMSQHTDRRQRWFLAACLVLAVITIFSDFRYVRRYRGVCASFPQQMLRVK